jgi:hypothetical protein
MPCAALFFFLAFGCYTTGMILQITGQFPLIMDSAARASVALFSSQSVYLQVVMFLQIYPFNFEHLKTSRLRALLRFPEKAKDFAPKMCYADFCLSGGIPV